MSKQDVYESIKKNLNLCRDCQLHENRTQPVPGSGNIEADIMFVGEAPGSEEDLAGKPFIGETGKFLAEMVSDAGMDPKIAFVDNVVHCKPPDNRIPTDEEARTCIPYLKKQIDNIKPKVIILLGSTPFKHVLGKNDITDMYGKWFGYRGIPVMALYHPTYIQRNNNHRHTVIEGLVKVRTYLEKHGGTLNIKDTAKGSNEYRYLHGVNVRKDGEHALVMNLKNVETGESKLEIVENPIRPFWVTKKQHRSLHTSKKEWASEQELDMYQVREGEMIKKAGQLLEFSGADKFKRKSVLNSPYIYGADIDPRVIYKRQYAKNCTTPISYTKIGHLDIETSVTGTREILMICFVDTNSGHVYQGVLKHWLKARSTSTDEIHKLYGESRDKFSEMLLSDPNKVGPREIFKSTKYELFIEDFEDEIELIRWVFSKIHSCKPDLVGIWNIDFDAPKMIERIKELGYYPPDIMCHPDVPPKWRNVYYKKDIQTRDHITDKRHWLDVTGYTQFVCAMTIYSNLRTAAGKEESYSLDHIAGKCLGTGKLDFGADDHYIMQTTRFCEYAVYNIFDTIILDLLERINNDYTNFVALVGSGLMCTFMAQTVQIKYFFYNYCRDNNCVSGSSGGNMEIPGDEHIRKVGGQVLDPNSVNDTGVAKLKGCNLPTQIQMFVCDLDVASMYPSFVKRGNVSKETKLYTVVQMEKGGPDEIEDLFACASDPEINSIRLGEYFNLPGFEEMKKLADAEDGCPSDNPYIQ